MAREGARPSYDPAGHDGALRTALQDLRTGRWMAMRTLLADTPSWWQWTQRTQVLAAAAAGTDVVRAWLAEEPHSVPATVMHARVGVERALRAQRERHRRTHELWIEAWDAAQSATEAAPHDPVPWVCLLALAQLDPEQRWEEHRAPPPEPMLPPGPWGLLAEAGRRDPHNREAHHRMLQFLYAIGSSDRLAEAAGYAQWAAASAPPASALHLLPLYVRVERYRRGSGHDAALDLHWVAEDATREAQRALHSWFERAPRAERSLLDLNHLAHALWGALRFPDAARVFDAIGPYFTPPPWMYRTPDRARAVEVFLQARDRCRAAAEDSGTHP
ncbi:hypothetical protein AQI88_01090 [Streptomyces cellostaticus]|uniref:DUF4034 domain-containing protein n=1 Tax=Streptomyces cellostaticus TaxID=67285 RepID=A0A117PYB6_9ACTN|nr:hypothetical protein [Streptomyces cellostaticus]KUM98872.1 hypothetical protein AQI88_01090 [Streptomyces cellostaticus]GHI03316.1 hypothetical protein Scel_16370 [Streptomyces cellostaticus]